MKNVILLIALFLNFVIMVFVCVNHVSLVLDNAKYQYNYESMREELESYYRTQGKGIDPAFVCKFKVKNGR